MVRHYFFGKSKGDMWAVTEISRYAAQSRLVHRTVAEAVIPRKTVNDPQIVLFTQHLPIYGCGHWQLQR